MDLTNGYGRKTLQGKRASDDTASCGDDVKKVKCNSSETCLIYDHSRDSKENIISEMPLDMSQGHKSGVLCEGLAQQKSKSLDLSLRVMRETLRNEETALLLLRKLQHSQQSLEVRGGLSVIGGIHRQNNLVNSNVTVTPQSNAAGRMLIRPQRTNHMASSNSSTVSTQHADSHQHHQVQPVSKMLVNGTATVKESNMRPHPSPTVVQQNHEQTMAQRQALAKLAIRRQLEATLLKLPMPKFTPQEMPFIPTIGFYADFIALVGMEEAIACISNEVDSAEVGKLPLPLLQCAHCQTDSTPQWTPEKQGSNSVICELCAMKSRKQAFREEHTAQLKAAFYQALQQQQQLEKSGAVA